MHLKSEGAGLAGLGASVDRQVVQTAFYPTLSEISTVEYAERKVATRFRLRIETAKLVVHLAGLGNGGAL